MISTFLEQIFRIFIVSMCAFVFYIFIKMLEDFFQDRNKKEQKENANKIYTKRKRQFEGDETGWKKWRDANYKITDLIEGDMYY